MTTADIKADIRAQMKNQQSGSPLAPTSGRAAKPAQPKPDEYVSGKRVDEATAKELMAMHKKAKDSGNTDLAKRLWTAMNPYTGDF